jgi:hypothetical protein
LLYILCIYSGFESNDDTEQSTRLAPRSGTFPIRNYLRDTEHEDDFGDDWDWLENDTGPSYGPFTGYSDFNFDPGEGRPQDFYNAFFDERMYETIVHKTNQFAARKNQREFIIDLFFRKKLYKYQMNIYY